MKGDNEIHLTLNHDRSQVSTASPANTFANSSDGGPIGIRAQEALVLVTVVLEVAVVPCPSHTPMRSRSVTRRLASVVRREISGKCGARPVMSALRTSKHVRHAVEHCTRSYVQVSADCICANGTPQRVIAKNIKIVSSLVDNECHDQCQKD